MSIAAAQWDEARSLRLAMRLRGMDTERIPAMGMVREGVLRRAVGLTLEATGWTPKWSASPAIAPS